MKGAGGQDKEERCKKNGKGRRRVLSILENLFEMGIQCSQLGTSLRNSYKTIHPSIHPSRGVEIIPAAFG